MKFSRSILIVAGLALSAGTIGCGSKETYIPKDKLTPEQEAAVKAEDDAIFDEESGGNGTYVPPPKKRK
jgi:hypothetical protein